MDIRIISAGYDPKVYNAGKPEKTKVTKPASAASGSQEQVVLSNTSNAINSVKEAANYLPDVRIKVVEEIKAKIKINDYPIENNLDETIKKLLGSKVLFPY